MVVKSSKQYSGMVLALLFCVFCFFFLLVSVGVGIVFPLIASLLLLTGVLQYWAVMCRTLIFDETGCAIHFLGYTKHYAWDEIKTKRLMDYANSFGHRDPHKEGVYFAVKRTKVPAWLKPATYCLFTNPFRTFWVYFDPCLEHGKWDYVTPPIYVVEREQFISALAKWGIPFHTIK